MNPRVKAAIKKRNQLRRDITNKRKEWIEACREVTELPKEAKQESWEEYFADIDTSTSPNDMWESLKV